MVDSGLGGLCMFQSQCCLRVSTRLWLEEEVRLIWIDEGTSSVGTPRFERLVVAHFREILLERRMLIVTEVSRGLRPPLDALAALFGSGVEFP